MFIYHFLGRRRKLVLASRIRLSDCHIRLVCHVQSIALGILLEQRVRNGLNDDEGTTKIDIVVTVYLETLEILKIKESAQEVYKYTLYAVELNLDPCITETRV